ncbi:hypothetical protein GEMRC1_008261 [Eukaryota sp. GEM-RC1]
MRPTSAPPYRPQRHRRSRFGGFFQGIASAFGYPTPEERERLRSMYQQYEESLSAGDTQELDYLLAVLLGYPVERDWQDRGRPTSLMTEISMDERPVYQETVYRSRSAEPVYRREEPRVDANSIPSYRVSAEYESQERRCNICLENFQEGEVASVLPCMHTFHKTCLRRLFTSSNRCPSCRMEVE